MIRVLVLAAVLAIAGCARKQSAPPPAPPAATPEAQTGAVPQNAPPAPPAPSPQSETEQAAASQESNADSDHQERSDVSLERIASLPPAAQLPAGKWQPGVDYEPLVPAQPTNVPPGKVEVMEIFWLACPHCYDLEPYLRTWLKTKPAYVEFVRVPVIWQPIHRAHARLYYTLDALGRPGLLQKAFDTIHQLLERGQPPLVGATDIDTFKVQEQFALQNGVSGDEFTRAYNSFAVSSELQRAEELTQRYRVQSVPFIAVNGKYATDLVKARGPARLIELINDLAAAEHGR
jgi:protein dithiol oxidoreductase (disulfide-forming)